jgi:hypothetical protein
VTQPTTPRPAAAPRRYDANRQLLDHQILDSHNNPICKVDDIEIDLQPLPLRSGAPAPGPEAVALLSGPQLLGVRIGGVVGRLMTRSSSRLRAPVDPDLSRIPIALVEHVDSAVHLSATRDIVGEPALERWTRSHVVDKLPGASDDPG